MKFNHIGIATKNVEATTALLEFLGYQAGDVMYDDNQKVDLRFLYGEKLPTIELLFNNGEKSSPIDKIVEKNGTCVYHLCYETSDIDKTAIEMRKQHYNPIGIKRKSLINDGNVLFLYHENNVMIELLEVKEDEA